MLVRSVKYRYLYRYHQSNNRYDGDLMRLFRFASEHKLNLATGNIEKLMTDCKELGDALVVDALTLVIIAYHGFGCHDIIAVKKT